MDKVRFLMSDTSADVTAACREALEQKGVEVTVVEKDGLQILQKMLVVRPQVVLLDAFMPGLDALAVKQKYVAAGETHTTFLAVHEYGGRLCLCHQFSVYLIGGIGEAERKNYLKNFKKALDNPARLR